MNELKHLAIIMDGNGRWAKQQEKPRNRGHEAGAKTVQKITEYVAKSSIEYLTLYAFSTENWSRPKSEVSALMKLLERYLKKEQKTLIKNSVRFNYIGDIEPFSKPLKDALKATKELTKDNLNLTQTLALNYGSKDEIVRAVNTLIKEDKAVTNESLNGALDTKKMPEVDLLVRTGGQSRVSNFLLWQIAYAELYFTPTLWPDFTTEELKKIITSYQKTHRRFGGL